MTASSISLLKDSTPLADRLVELYWERAYRFAVMITRNDQESADIAQEALTKVLGSTQIKAASSRGSGA